MVLRLTPAFICSIRAASESVSTSLSSDAAHSA